MGQHSRKQPATGVKKTGRKTGDKYLLYSVQWADNIWHTESIVI
jgi:hypothetical protein